MAAVLRRTLTNLGRFATGLILFHSGFTLLYALTLLPLVSGHSFMPLTFAVGFITGLAVFTLVNPFRSVYVFGHELTHWLMAKLFFRRTGRFRVRGARGSVDVERPNVWILLAPYFIPIYTVVWMGLYGLCLFLCRPHPLFCTRDSLPAQA